MTSQSRNTGALSFYDDGLAFNAKASELRCWGVWGLKQGRAQNPKQSLLGLKGRSWVKIRFGVLPVAPAARNPTNFQVMVHDSWPSSSPYSMTNMGRKGTTDLIVGFRCGFYSCPSNKRSNDDLLQVFPSDRWARHTLGVAEHQPQERG